jgi:hypothetical protein
MLNAAVRYTPRQPDRAPPKQLWLALAASGLATLANPYGLRLYSTVLTYAGQGQAFNTIVELSPMSFHEPQHFAALLLLLGAIFAIGWRRDPQPLWLLLIAVSSFMAFRMVREIWFVSVVSACVIADGWLCSGAPVQFSAKARATSRTFPSARRHVLVALWVIALLIAACQRYGLSNLLLEVQVAGSFPEGASRYIEQHHLTGPLLNDLSWGGFLIWRLPELPVSMDGRTNVHGQDRILEFSALWKGKPGWSTDPELARANLVLTPKDAAIASLLRNDSRFSVAYEDVQALVFQRK